MANTVNFKIQLEVDGQQRVVNATADIGNLVKEVGVAEKAANRFSNAFADLANVSMALDGVTNTIGQMQRALQGLTAAYAVQEQNEKRLETVMRERMGATEADIQQMKELASAQQAVGVIGDEVQLAGMQQVSTFLHEKEALEQLVPAMNDLIAQQNGLNATQQDAQSIGNLLGKAMQGQTEALQRVGISFNEAQKEVMKTGTEMERASMLAEIITQNVGNMNEELRNTSSGEMKALENTIGDVKERLGELVQGVMPFLTIAANFTMAASGALKLATAVKSLGVAHGVAAAGAVAHNLQLKLMTAMMRQGIATATGLRLALQALKVASIIGIAIAALTEAVIYFTGKSEEATDAAGDLADGIDDIKESEQSYTHAAAEAKVAMDKEISSLGDLMNSHKDTTAAVNHLNEEYGTVFGNHQTAAEWYDVLIKKSKDYCAMLGYEAQMKVLASKKAAAEIELDKMRRDLLSFGGEHTRGNYSQEDAAKLDAMTSGVEKQKKVVDDLAESWDAASKKFREASAGLGGIGTPGAGNAKGPRPSRNIRKTEKSPAPVGTLGWIDEEISKKEAQLKVTLDPGSRADIEKEIDSLNARKHYIEVSTRLKKDSGADLQKEITDLTEQQINTPSIEVPVTALNDEGKLAIRQDMENKASTIQRRYEIGLINKDQAQKELDEINSLAKELSMNPIHLSFETEELDKAREKFDFATDSMKQMGSGLSSLGNALEIPELNVAGVIAQSIATLVQSYAAATLQASTMGPWAWIAFAAVGLAQLAAIVTSVKSMGAFADGGIVGGSSWSGDRLTARVNSGEMILNRQQQRRLWEIVNGQRSVSQEVRPNLIQIEQQAKPLIEPGAIVGKLRGRDIVLVAGNESQIGAKSGRRTRILG